MLVFFISKTFALSAATLLSPTCIPTFVSPTVNELLEISSSWVFLVRYTPLLLVPWTLNDAFNTFDPVAWDLFIIPLL